MKRGKLFIILTMFLLAFSVLVFADCECIDMDGDGYGAFGAECCENDGIDCNDNNPNIYPGAEINYTDGLDNNCDGNVYVSCIDSDLDGYNNSMYHPILCPEVEGEPCCAADETQVDCDDSNALINPGMEPIYGDGLNNDCNPDWTLENDEFPVGTSSTENVCEISDSYWVDCDGNEITTANEGDSVYLIVAVQNCNEFSLVDFIILENDTEELIDLVTEEYYLEDDLFRAWAASWKTEWFDDESDDPNPNYYFNAMVNTPSDGTFEKESPILTVEKCPEDNPNCGVECTLDIPGFTYIGSRSSRSGSQEEEEEETCAADWDCSGVKWSECDPVTNKMTRDINNCIFIGTGDDECKELSKADLVSERSCMIKDDGEVLVEEEFDDMGISQEKEKSFPWIWVIIIGLLLILIIGAILYYLKLTGVLDSGDKTQKMPFTNKKDLKAVVDYIKLAKSKGLKDEQIKTMLKKSGWKQNQITYAFKELTK